MLPRRYNYVVKFDDKYNAFYVYSRTRSRRCRESGSIPAGIDVIYKGRHLSTILIMGLIHRLWLLNKFPKHLLVYDMDVWYTKKNKLNKPLLYELVKELEDYCT